MKNVDTRKLLKVQNYDDGVNGNMLVVLTDKVIPLSITGPDGDERDVEALLCTASITDNDVVDVLETMVDKDTPCNKVIVVSEKFRKLNNKLQLILLEIENQKYRAGVYGVDNNIAPLMQAEITAIEKFGIVAEWVAVRTARCFREKSQRRAAKGLHKQYKKDIKLEKDMAKAARDIFKNEEKKEANEPDPAPAV